MSVSPVGSIAPSIPSITKETSIKDPLANVLKKLVLNAIKETGISFWRPLADRIVEYVCCSSHFFDDTYWENLIGKVPPAPPLPEDFNKIWDGPCPFYPEKTLSQTHLLVYIPKTVNDNPLTLKHFLTLTQFSFLKQTNHFIPLPGYRIKDTLIPTLGDKPIKRSHWVLITKDILRNSKDRSIATHRLMVTKEGQLDYQMPSLLKAVICSQTHLLACSRPLFSVNDSLPIYTRCQESTEEEMVLVGNDESSLLIIYQIDETTLSDVGVAAMKTLSIDPYRV